VRLVQSLTTGIAWWSVSGELTAAGMVAGRAGAQGGGQPAEVVTGRNLGRRIDRGRSSLEDTFSPRNLHKESLKYFSNYSAVPGALSRNPYSNSENVNLAGLSKMRFPIITELPLILFCS